MNKEIPLMLDSTVLKQVPKLNSQLFKELIKHVHVDVFKLYISEIVEREYLTWIKGEAQQAFDNVVKATESLNKYYEEPELFGMKLSFNVTAGIAHDQIKTVLKKVVNNWEDFKKSTNATILPIESSHGNLVMNSYFSGEMPFKSIKCRSDIPDGFIYCSIVGLLEKNEKVLFVSRDKNLVKRINGDQIVCFENLAELFSNEEYKIQENFFRELKDSDRATYLFKYFTDEVQRKAKREIEFSDLICDIEDELKEDVIGEYADVSSSVKNIELDNKNIKIISESSYLLPFNAELVHSVSSEASKSDLSFFSEARINNLEKNINDDGQFEVSEPYRNKVQGNLSVTFAESSPLSWKEKEAEDILSEPEIEEITMSLEDIKLIS